MTDPVVRLNGVVKRYGEVTALRGIDLEVPAGTVLGLVGPNGAGKTTTIRILVGSLPADAGQLEVMGLDPLRNKHEVRAQIGYMPQDLVLYDDLTTRENIAFFARGHLSDGVDDAVWAAIEFAGLEEHADRLVANLSGGLQRRVSLAAAIVHRPKILFLDEPTAGVDPELRHAFWMRFRALTDNGTTIVVSTHQLDEVAHCDRVVVLRAGAVLADMPPADLLAVGGATVTIHTASGAEVHEVASLPDDLPRVLQPHGLDPKVRRIEVVGPTLEQVMLKLIERDGGASHDAA